MAGWVKAVLFLLGGVGAAAGTAYVTGMLDPWLAPKPAEISSLVDAPGTAADEKAPQNAAETAAEPADAAPAEAAEDETAADPVTTPKTDRLAPPVFDLLRVEADGSVLVAGKAVPDALVEVLSGDAVLGKASAGTGGDFVVVLDRLLPPGDYRLTLRATSPEGETALSDGTAIVSIPEAKDGQVLAMVEAPGQPAQLIAVPQAEAAPVEEPATETAAEARPEPAEAQEEAKAEAEEQPEVAQAEPEQAPAEPEPEPEPEAAPAADAEAEAAEDAAPGTQAAPQPAAVPSVSVEAVEIEGGTIFVAGRADPGRTVRVYAGSVFLGDAVAYEGGRFLIEARRHLDVGNYLIRADLLGDDGAVVARAGVPFEREPGETLAAVAPAVPQPEPQPEQPAAAETAGGGEEAAARPDAATNEAADEAAEEVATAPALQRVDGAVIIRRGDSLWRISRRVYGHGIRYSTIYLANQDQIRDPNRIWPGQVFSVPGETPEGEKADLGAVGDQAVKPEDRDAAGK